VKSNFSDVQDDVQGSDLTYDSIIIP